MIFSRGRASRDVANKLYSQKKYKKALIEYLKVLERDPNDSNTNITVSNIYHIQGDDELAIEYLDRVAGHYSERGFSTKSEVLYKKMIRLDPNNIRGHRGLFNFCLNKKASAVGESQREELKEKALEELGIMAQILEKDQSLSQAIKCYQAILDMDPRNIEACIKLSSVFCAQEKISEALNLLSKTARHCISVEALDEASRVINVAETLDPKHINTQVLKAHLSLVGGALDQGVLLLEQVYNKDPDSFVINKLLGQAYIQKGDIEGAKKHLHRLFEMDNTQAHLLERLVLFILKNGDVELAFQTMQPILGHYWQLNDTTSVKKLLMKAYQYDHNHVSTLNALSHVHRVLNDMTSALFYKEKEINLHLESENTSQAIIEINELLLIDPSHDGWNLKLKELLQEGDVVDEKVSATVEQSIVEIPKSSQKETNKNPELDITLPEKELFDDRIKQSLKQANRIRKKAGLLVINFDRKRWTSSNHSIITERDMILEVASRIVPCIRETDSLGYFGGDVFGVLLNELMNPGNLERIAKKIKLRCSEEPLENAGEPVYINSSMGAAIYPEDGQDAESLKQYADFAMQRATDIGLQSFVFYTDKMNVEASRRWDLERDLKKAIACNELDLHYQPIYRLGQEVTNILGFEALLRWEHPILGRLYPHDFIELLNDDQLAEDFNQWITDALFEQVVKWHSLHSKTFWLSVNVNIVQICHQSFSKVIENFLEKIQSENMALKLILEGKESDMLDSGVHDDLQSFRKKGVSLAIDHFGEGLTSLIHLHRSPIDIIKLDGSSIEKASTDEGTAVFIKAVLQMAEVMGLMIIAEGIENGQQLSFLFNAGLPFAQGYLLSKPKSADEIISLIQNELNETTHDVTETQTSEDTTIDERQTAFMQLLKETTGKETHLNIAHELLDWARIYMPDIMWNKGKQINSFTPHYVHSQINHQIVKVQTSGNVEMQFQYLKSKSPPFTEKSMRIELLDRLNAIPGIELKSNVVDKRPKVNFSVFENEHCLVNFKNVLEWVVQEIKDT